MIKRACDACEQEYEARTVRSRFCQDKACVRRRAREQKRKKRSAPVLEHVDQDVELDDQESGFSSAVSAAVLAELEDVGRVDSALGRAALVLARRADRASFGDSGSSLASVVRELRATLAVAVKGAQVEGDIVDELQQQRAKRIGRSG